MQNWEKPKENLESIWLFLSLLRLWYPFLGSRFQGCVKSKILSFGKAGRKKCSKSCFSIWKQSGPRIKMQNSKNSALVSLFMMSTHKITIKVWSTINQMSRRNWLVFMQWCKRWNSDLGLIWGRFYLILFLKISLNFTVINKLYLKWVHSIIMAIVSSWTSTRSCIVPSNSSHLYSMLN